MNSTLRAVIFGQQNYLPHDYALASQRRLPLRTEFMSNIADSHFTPILTIYLIKFDEAMSYLTLQHTVLYTNRRNAIQFRFMPFHWHRLMCRKKIQIRKELNLLLLFFFRRSSILPLNVELILFYIIVMPSATGSSAENSSHDLIILF